VLPLVSRVLADYPGFDAAIKMAIETYYHRDAAHHEVASLRDRRTQLLMQIEYWVKHVSTFGNSLVDEKTAPLQVELLKVTERLIEVEKKQAEAAPSAQKLAKLAGAIKKVGQHLQNLPTPIVRQIMQILVAKMEGDLITKHVELELHLPSWLLQHPEGLERGLVEEACYKSFNETPLNYAVLIGKFRLNYTGGRRGRTKGEYSVVQEKVGSKLVA
jgi:hypothetical protein